MPTFQQRIEDYIGAVEDTTGLDQFLTDSARDVLSLASSELVRSYASREKTTSNAGYSIRNKRVVSVSRGGYRATEVFGDDRQRILDSDSLFYVGDTPRSPAFYVQVTANDTRLFVKPDPASGSEADIWYVAYPSISSTASTATGLPPILEDVTVLGAALRVLAKRLADHEEKEDAEMVAVVAGQMERMKAMHTEKMAAVQESQ